MLDASGSRICNAGTQRNSRSVIEILKEYQGWPNLDGATNEGAGPKEWAAYLTGWKRGHENEATTRPELKDGDNIIFESTIVVFSDDRNALVDKAYKYVLLKENLAAKEGYNR